MSLAENIIKHIQNLPESVQAEVLDFVEYLESKINKGTKFTVTLPSLKSTA